MFISHLFRWLCAGIKFKKSYNICDMYQWCSLTFVHIYKFWTHRLWGTSNTIIWFKHSQFAQSWISISLWKQIIFKYYTINEVWLHLCMNENFFQTKATWKLGNKFGVVGDVVMYSALQNVSRKISSFPQNNVDPVDRLLYYVAFSMFTFPKNHLQHVDDILLHAVFVVVSVVVSLLWHYFSSTATLRCVERHKKIHHMFGMVWNDAFSFIMLLSFVICGE